MLRRRVLWIVLFSVIGVMDAAAQSAPALDSSAKHVVQEFYDWYVPRAAKANGTNLIMSAARRRALPFDAELLRWLWIDSIAQTRAPKGELDGLDWDPYLDSQDPCRRYRATGVSRRGTTYDVEVRGSGGCPPNDTVDVVVRLMPRPAGWTVVDFRYPRRPADDLIGDLKRLHPTLPKK